MLDINWLSVDVNEIQALQTDVLNTPDLQTFVRVYVFLRHRDDPLIVDVDFLEEEDAAAEWCDIIKGELSRKKELTARP
jgi:hypothetical protein